MRIVEQSFKIELPNSKEVAIYRLKELEEIGRVCYKTEDKITEDSYIAFLKMIMKNGHHSVIEHVQMRARIIADRGISHELVRHRLASYSQESTRYCNYGKDRFGGQITVVEPPGLTGISRMLWMALVKQSEATYLDLLDGGVPIEIARSVLPTCLRTELVMTANIREWRHIFQLRTSAAAHPQIRSLMKDGLGQAKELFPIIFDDIPI